MVFGSLFNIGRRLLPAILKGASRGFGLIKRLISPASLIRGAKAVGSVAKKAGEVGAKIATGIEVAKQLPVIGSKVRSALEKTGAEKRLGQAQQLAGQIGGVASQAETQFARLQDPLRA